MRVASVVTNNIVFLYMISLINGESDRNYTVINCENGFRKIDDNCVVINECEEESGICSEAECVNKIGTYECVCADGYTRKHNVCKSDTTILYTTYTSINTLKLDDENFNASVVNNILIDSLSDPRDIYYSLHGNYILFENIGAIYANPMFAGKESSIKSEIGFPLRTEFRANTKLCIDWIHNLIYWISGKDKKKIVAADIKNISNQVLIARVEYYQIKCLAVNPIDSFILWTEYDDENGLFVIYKALQDGSDKYSVFDSQIMVREIVIDYQSKRIFLLRSDDLLSINYEGSNKIVITRNAGHIYDFDVLSDYIYWIEYSGEHLYKSSVNGFDSNRSNISFNAVVNHFQIVNQWRQPIDTNRCFNVSCVGVCLPIHKNGSRCACNDNLCEIIANITYSYGHIRSIVTTPASEHHFPTNQFTASEEPITQSNSTEQTTEHTEPNSTIVVVVDEKLTENYSTSVTSEKPLVWLKTSTESSVIKSSEKIILNSNNRETVTTENLKTVDNKSLTDENINSSKIVSFSTIKYANTDTDSQKLIRQQLSINETATKSSVNTSEPPIFAISSSKQYSFEYNVDSHLIYGLSLLVIGIFIGAILTAIVIRIQGKRNGKNKYHTTNKWDSVGFHKSESNVYFGARYRLNDDNFNKYS